MDPTNLQNKYPVVTIPPKKLLLRLKVVLSNTKIINLLLLPKLDLTLLKFWLYIKKGEIIDLWKIKLVWIVFLTNKLVATILYAYNAIYVAKLLFIQLGRSLTTKYCVQWVFKNHTFVLYNIFDVGNKIIFAEGSSIQH